MKIVKDPPRSAPSQVTCKGDLTLLLEGWAKGDKDALDRLFFMVVDELRAMARGALAREGHYVSLQPTELVSKVCIRMLEQKVVHWESRAQFFAFSSMLMRRILVDCARRRLARKRSAVEVPYNDDLGISDEMIPRILALEGALTDLEKLDPLQARIVVMRFYGGWTITEIAAAWNIGSTTVKRRWSSAKLWLRRYLQQQQCGPIRSGSAH